MNKIVVALGGNALGDNPLEQREAVKKTAKSIVELIEKGYKIIVTHGNGPQVGMINLSFDLASSVNDDIPLMPFPECGAMSQGYIGFHLQNAIKNELKRKNIDKPVTTLVSQVIVDQDDPAFDELTKPVGAFYDKEKALALEKEKGYTMIEDSGRGYRRVVASPLPKDIVEKETILNLVSNDEIVISCGGGGVPVIKEESGLLKHVSAVVDKDFISALLAEIVDADLLLISTGVDRVALNFGTKDEKWLSELSVEKAHEYCKGGHFGKGSMLPKVKAAAKFAESSENNTSIITSLEKMSESISGKAGTIIN